MNFDISTMIAICSFAISLVSLVLSIRAIAIDKGKLSLDIQIGKISTNSNTDVNPPDAICITVVNSGRRPLKLKYVAAIRRGSIPLFILPFFRYAIFFNCENLTNQSLKEGADVSTEHVVTQSYKRSLQRVYCLFAVDSRGKRHYVSGRKIKIMRERLSSSNTLENDPMGTFLTEMTVSFKQAKKRIFHISTDGRHKHSINKAWDSEKKSNG